MRGEGVKAGRVGTSAAAERGSRRLCEAAADTDCRCLIGTRRRRGRFRRAAARSLTRTSPTRTTRGAARRARSRGCTTRATRARRSPSAAKCAPRGRACALPRACFGMQGGVAAPSPALFACVHAGLVLRMCQPARSSRDVQRHAVASLLRFSHACMQELVLWTWTPQTGV